MEPREQTQLVRELYDCGVPDGTIAEVTGLEVSFIQKTTQGPETRPINITGGDHELQYRLLLQRYADHMTGADQETSQAFADALRNVLETLLHTGEILKAIEYMITPYSIASNPSRGVWSDPYHERLLRDILALPRAEPGMTTGQVWHTFLLAARNYPTLLPGSPAAVIFAIAHDIADAWRPLPRWTSAIKSEVAARLDDAVASLDGRTRDIVQTRYRTAQPQEFHTIISTRYALSPARVRQIESRARQELGAILARDEYMRLLLSDANALFETILSLQGTIARSAESPTRLAELAAVLNTPLSRIEMSVRLHKCLREAQCDTLADVAQKTEWEFLKIRHLGRKTLQELKDILAVRGLSLGMRFNQTQLDALKHPQNDA